MHFHSKKEREEKTKYENIAHVQTCKTYAETTTKNQGGNAKAFTSPKTTPEKNTLTT
jgi:hypothetical protein